MTFTEELFILKTLIRMLDEALLESDPIILLQISVDIAESAEKLEQLACDYANAD